jgi:hypothetical protein
MRQFISRAWPGLQTDLLAIASIGFVALAVFGLHLAFGWDPYKVLLGWIGFIAAKSHVRLTRMGEP